jgi:hypothetical protein
MSRSGNKAGLAAKEATTMDLKALLARDDKPRFSAARREPFLLRIRKVPGQSDLMFVTPTAGSDRSCKEVQQANGTIFRPGAEGGDVDLVAMGMSRVAHMDALPEELPATQSVQVAEDGTVLNIFLRDDTVHASTARRPDAKEARWASDRSFWDFLMDAIPGGEPTLRDALKEGFTYSVVLRHPGNTVVLPHSEARIVHVSTRRMDTLQECDEPLPGWAARPSWVTLEQARQIHNDVENFTKHGGMPPIRGFLLVDATEPTAVRRTLFDLPSYRLAASLRKNKKYPHHSYLACSPEERLLCRRVFYMLTPEYDTVDYWLSVLYREVHRKYMRTYVRKTEALDVNHPFAPLLRACHKRYKRTRERVDLPTCEAVLSTGRWVDLDRALSHLSAERAQ